MTQVFFTWGTALLLWVLSLQADWLPLIIIGHLASIFFLLVGLASAIAMARQDD